MNARRISIDAGQSSIRVRLGVGAAAREFSEPGIRNDRDAVDQVAEVLRRQEGPSASSVAVGLSGFDARTDAARRLSAAAPGAAVRIAHDAVTGYLGANGAALGVTAAIGTGSVVLGVGATKVARVDGWGALLGDAGSAHWIGRAGLDAALRAFDGRGAHTRLHADALTDFGALDQLYLRLQADPERVQRIAEFAPRVTAAAAVGDGAATAILDGAAAEITASIMAALRQVGVTAKNARLSTTGQTIAAPELRDRVTRALSATGSGAVLSPALGEPIDGVDALHELDADHPLAGLIVIHEPNLSAS